MFGVIKSLLGKEERDATVCREEFIKAKNDLETIAMLTANDFSRTHKKAISAVFKLRYALASGAILTTKEKIELVALLNKIKVKSASVGTLDGYQAFQMLDSVSEDIKRFL
ncbi:MAG: hypothetical protein QW590_01440 [Candidatus Bilamarchaeaceae archaeon]